MQQTDEADIRRPVARQSVEPNIATVKEVFRLQGQPELDAAEKKYLPKIKLPGPERDGVSKEREATRQKTRDRKPIKLKHEETR